MSDLHNKAAKGEAARHAIDVMQETFARCQAGYLSELVTAYRKGLEVETAAAKLTVLDDIINDLVGDVQTGKRAQEKIRQQREHLNG